MKRYEPIINMIISCIWLIAGWVCLYILLFLNEDNKTEQILDKLTSIEISQSDISLSIQNCLDK